LVYAGTTSTNYLTYNFTGTANSTNRAFTASVTVYFLMQPGNPQPSGSYTDSLSFEAYNLNACAAGCNPIYTTAFTVTGKVNGSCTIGGVGFVDGGRTDGAVTVATTPPTGFTNMINYAATATFSGAAASLDTSLNPAATGPESGTAVSTTGTTPAGALAVTITPKATTSPLVIGTYKDVLTITITPQ
jgi:hypothetical protein